MPDIHPTAVVDANAQIADDVVIGPFCVIGPHVKIGRGTILKSHVVVDNHTTIGEDNKIYSHCTLGQDPQDLKFHGEPATLIIGDRNEIREHVSMHIGTENGGGSTTVGSENMLMVGTHVAHDSHIHNRCILANNVQLAGHITIHDHAILSGSAGVHHFVTIGKYAFIGGMSRIVHDCPPFMITDGHPARVRGVNMVGLKRHEFSEDQLQNLKVGFKRLYHKDVFNQGEALDQLESEFGNDANVMELCRFARLVSMGIHGRQAEAERQDDKYSAPTK